MCETTIDAYLITMSLNEQDLTRQQILWEQLNNNKTNNEIEEMFKQNKFGWRWYDSMIEQLEELTVASGALICPRCGDNHIITRMQQTRSCDEGQTVVCKCSKCFKNWIATN